MSARLARFDFQGRVARADLAALVDAAGGASRLSPRSLLGPASPLLPAASPSFAEAAGIVAAARVNLTLRLWSGEQAAVEMNALFPASPAAGKGVVLHLAGTEIEVAGFVDAERILSLVAPALPPEPPVAPPPFEIQADGDTMTVLAACLDRLHAEALHRRLSRMRNGWPLSHALLDGLPPLAGIEVAACVKERWGFSRFDELLTAVFPLAGRTEPPTLSEIDAALQRLVRIGLLQQARPDRFRPAEVLEPVMRGLLGLRAGLQWQRVGLLPDDTAVASERIFLFGNGGAVFTVQPASGGGVRLSLGTRRQAIDFMVAELSPRAGEVASPPAAAPPATLPPAAAAPRFCGACGKPLKDGWKFCGACGAPVKEGRDAGH